MDHELVRLFASSRMTHDRLANGIHIFTFYESSRDALDDWFAELHKLWQDDPSHTKPIPMLINSSACGTQPLGYAYREATRLYAACECRPILYTAFVERSLIMVRVLDAFLHILHTTPYVRYFTGGQDDQAMSWLESLL